jgi:hypothetical protein
LRNIIFNFLLGAFLLLNSKILLADAESAKAHNELFAKEEFPSAKECATCHVEHFKEWSVSPHAYAQISPVFNAMHAATVKRTNGTMGDFCIRCHTPTGMQKGEPIFESNLKRDPVSNEGITCVTCHRRNMPVGKSSGRFQVFPGDIFKPVYGPFDGKELERVIRSGEYEVNANPKKKGRNIHTKAEEFDQITTSGYCGTCHDVNGPTGFRLEEAFSDYKAAPAAANGQSCQDCHMGKEPGKVSGYDFKAVAVVGGKPTNPRKKTNHMFVGPDYSVVHPGIYPHSSAADEVATPEEWLKFNYKAGWGTSGFEDEVEETYQFPEKWNDQALRFRARAVIDDNIKLLKHAADQRKILLKEGYRLGEIKVDTEDGLSFDVEVKNGTDGHNVPTGFDAERIVYLRTTVKDSNGKIVFLSGDFDPNGDLRDRHSLYVKNGELPRDDSLFSLQSKFLVNMIRGGDREEVLPINHSNGPLPFVRPPIIATLLTGRPNDARKHRQTLAPLSGKNASYEVPKENLNNKAWPLQLKVELVAGMVPVNLVHEISDVGFDYGMSSREIAEAVVDGYQVLWEKEVKVEEGK